MKIKMAATMLLCSIVILCGELSAAGSSGQLLQSADCGCGAAPMVEDCGCGTADEGCGCRQPVRGLLSKLRSGCGGGCGGGCEAAPVADCGCGAAPVADCGCEAAPSCGCRAGKGFRGLLERIGGQVPSDCGCGPTCEEPEPVVADCGCAPEPAPSCGCEAAPAQGCGCLKGGLLGRLTSRGCGCGGSAPAGAFGGTHEVVAAPVADCGCAPAPAADCGCDAAPAAASSCGCKVGGLIGRLRSRSCGCGSAAPAPADDCGCAPEPVADCGCDAAPAAAPSCGCSKGGLLGRLTSRGCGCGSAAPAPAVDCGCAPEPAPAPAADCGCDAAPSCGGGNGGLLGRLGSRCGGCGSAAADCGCGAAVGSSCGGGNGGLLGGSGSRCGGCGSAAADCGCGAAVGSSCGSNGGGLLAGGRLGQRLTGGCNRCGKSSCNGGCRRNRDGVTLLNRLRGDRIVRDTSNCGRCMPACPNKDAGCGCSSCGNAGMVYDHAPSMQVAPAVQPMAPVAVPATTEGTMVPAPVVPTGANKNVQPVVDSAAFIIRNQR